MNKKNIKYVIVVLIMVVILISGYFIYDKLIKNDKNLDKVKEASNWMEYLLNTDTKKIEVSTYHDDNYDDSKEGITKKSTLTKDKLNELFNSLKTCSFKKTYHSGIGITGDTVTLSLEYVLNQKKYNFEIINGFIYSTSDESETGDDFELMKLFDKEKYQEEHKEANNEAISYIYSIDSDCFSSIIDTYIK